MTTKRVRNHELEELSLAALRFALPPKWVIHDFRKDYGIDVQIELFEVDGLATGLRCYGQLKATDSANDDDVLSLDRDHFEYWAAHTDPVLLLRYYANTQQFSWCWLHDVAWSLKPNVQSLSVARFLQPWDAKVSPKTIQDFLRQRSCAFTERQRPPFEVSISGNNVPIERLVEVAEVVHGLASQGTFRFIAGSQHPASFGAVLTPNGVVCSYLGLPGVVVEGMDEPSAESFARMVLLLVFLTACRYDRILAARPLARNCFSVLLKAAGEKFFFPLIDSLVYAVGLEDATKLVRSVNEAELPEAGEVLFPGVAYVAAQRYGEAEQWVAMLRYELAGSTVDEHRAATAYSLGNALSNANQWADALPMFKLAADTYPEYFKRGYFRHEYGAALFENGLFAEAAEQYRAALALEPTPRLRYLLGDVLYCAGEFADALVELDAALSGELDDDSRSFALLLRILCCEMGEAWGVNRLDLAKLDDGGISALQAFTSEDKKNLPAVIRPLLKKFGTDALFNFNAGHLANISAYPELATYRYLHCAMRQRGDSEAWALAIGCAIAANAPRLMTLGVIVGYFYVGERLLVDFFKVSQFAGASPAVREEFQKMFADIAHSGAARQKDEPLTLRFFGSDQTDVFEVSR